MYIPLCCILLLVLLYKLTLTVHCEPTHGPAYRQSYPLARRYFSKSWIVKSNELFAPLWRYLCSTLIKPVLVRSSIARFTVDLDIDRSIAILRSDGQHLPPEFAFLYEIKIHRYGSVRKSCGIYRLKVIHFCTVSFIRF